MMILKSQVEWALHCCAILAGLPAGRFLSTKALAEFHGLPKEYLSKALQSLSQAGLVDTTLGPSGGYRLAKAPAELTFLDIVEAVEGNARTFVCNNIRANNPCRPLGYCESGPCAVARIMWEADEAWRQKLRSVRLSDLIETLSRDIPAQLWKSSFEWVLERAG
ncbi:Rrf2 family protein [Rhizobium sp. BK538]|nr:Rrf2 family protein [Rhizobium sp. BK538]